MKYIVSILSVSSLFIFYLVSIFAEESKFSTIMDDINNYKFEHGYPITDDYLYQKIFSSNLSDEELNIVIKFVQEHQSPLITKSDLLEIIKSKRDSIHSLQIKFLYYFIENDTSNNKDLAEKIDNTIEYAKCGLKEYIEIKDNISDSHTKYAFDGKIARGAYNLKSGYPDASIDDEVVRSKFYHPYSPISSIMLLDTSYYNESYENIDLVLFLNRTDVCIYEKMEIIDGINCILVATANTHVYLAPDYDFSVVRYKGFYHQFVLRSDGKPHFSGRSISSVRTLHNFQNYGNGIWFPQKMEEVFYRSSGQKAFEVKTELLSANINKVLPDSLFEDIIPENALVSDTTRNLVYKQSDSSSINSLIKETAKSKRVFIYRYISIISGLALIFIVLGLKYLAYLKAKRECKNKTVAEEDTK